MIYQRQCRVCLACCWYAVHNLYVFVGAAVLLVQVHEVISDILGAILFICCSVVCQVSLKPTNNANPLDV